MKAKDYCNETLYGQETPESVAAKMVFEMEEIAQIRRVRQDAGFAAIIREQCGKWKAYCTCMKKAGEPPVPEKLFAETLKERTPKIYVASIKNFPELQRLLKT